MSIFFLKKSTLLKDLINIALILKIDVIRLATQVSHPKTAKEPSCPPMPMADGSAGQKKFFKVKYFSGAFSYGAKI
jgi:hypothetical protein